MPNKGIKLPTKKQRLFLKRRGMNCPGTRAEAWELIRQTIAGWDARHIRIWQDQTLRDAWDELGDDDGLEKRHKREYEKGWNE